MAPDVGRGGGITREQALQPRLGRHLQGGFRVTRNPGLKPWAMMCSRFAAKARHVPAGRVSIFAFPGSKLPGYDHAVPTGRTANR